MPKKTLNWTAKDSVEPRLWKVLNLKKSMEKGKEKRLH